MSVSFEERTPETAQDFDEGAGGTNLVMAVLRRWPLVMLGFGVGLVAGVLMYYQSARVYASNSQVLVNKRSNNLVGAASASYAIVEDYVGTQISLIKSEKVLRPASLRLEQTQLRTTKLPDDENSRFAFLSLGIQITRDKEGMSGTMGSNILNISFRCGDAADSTYILGVIIETYKKELENVYDETTRKEMETLTSLIAAMNKDLSKLDADKVDKSILLQKISPEELTTLQARYSEKRRQYDLERSKLSDFKRQLKIIEATGPNKRDREDALYKLGIRGRVNGLSEDLNNVSSALTQARFKLDTYQKKYGKDHPVVVDAQTQVQYLQQLDKSENPVGTAEGGFDELSRHKSFVQAQIVSYEEVVTFLDRDLDDDQKKAMSMGSLTAEINGLKDRISRAQNDIIEQQAKKVKIEATKGAGGYDATIINKPSAGLQVAPNLTRMMSLWAVLGVLLGAGIALAVELTDKSFRTPAEIRSRLRLPVIGHIPPIRTQMDNEEGRDADIEPTVVSHLRPKSTEAEAYRGVRTSLYFSTQGRGHQVIQVTSPNPGDGKSTLAANLAVSIAQSGKRVVLVDCDFRKPRVHKIFHIDRPDVGLASIINGDATFAQAIRTTVIENLSILPCGPRPKNPAELLTSPEFQDAVDKLRNDFDFVIIDTPPVLAVSDPLVVAPRVDGVLMVFRMTKKARPTAERARESLGSIGANVLGVVVNGIGGKRDDYYGYGYNYGYGYQYQYQYEYEYADDYTDSDVPFEDDPLAQALPAKG